MKPSAKPQYGLRSCSAARANATTSQLEEGSDEAETMRALTSDAIGDLKDLSRPSEQLRAETCESQANQVATMDKLNVEMERVDDMPQETQRDSDEKIKALSAQVARLQKEVNVWRSTCSMLSKENTDLKQEHVKDKTNVGIMRKKVNQLEEQVVDLYFDKEKTYEEVQMKLQQETATKEQLAQQIVDLNGKLQHSQEESSKVRLDTNRVIKAYKKREAEQAKMRKAEARQSEMNLNKVRENYKAYLAAMKNVTAQFTLSAKEVLGEQKDPSDVVAVASSGTQPIPTNGKADNAEIKHDEMEEIMEDE